MSAKKGIKTVIAELKKIGLSDDAIAGVLGNLEAESGWRPGVVNGSGHTGLAQWDTSRFARLKEMAAKNGWGSPTGWNAQAKYLAWEIKSGSGGTSVRNLNSAGSAARAADVFEAQFERSGRSNMSGRIAAAQKFAQGRLIGRTGTSSPTGAAPVRKVPGSKDGTMTWVPKVGPNVTQGFTGPGNYVSGNHSGVDIGGGTGGQPIRWAPPVTGKVISIGSTGAYGNHIVIRDEKKRDWLLAHMRDKPLVKVGDTLQQGDQIGFVGATGNARGAHLHIEQTRPGVKWVSGQDVKRAKITFKVGTNGQVYDKNFKPVDNDFLEMVGLSGQALGRPGNEELKQLIDLAVENDWTAQEFQRRFKKTQWYQDRASSQRDFDMLQDTEQQQKIKQARASARQASAQLGVELTGEELRKLAVRIARDGFSNEQIQWFIGRRYDPNKDLGGTAVATQEALRAKAREYGVRLDSTVLNKWTKEVLQRGTPVESFNDNMAEMAAQQNPYLQDAFGRGLTTREALGAYLSTAADLMGVQPDEIDISDAKWRNVVRPDGTFMTDQEWRKTIKSDPRYGYGNTRNGVREAQMHGRNMLRTLGVFGG